MPFPVRSDPSSAEVTHRFWAKVGLPDENGCWPWTGCVAARYGQIQIRPRRYKAHRLAYELLIGPIKPVLRALGASLPDPEDTP